METLRRPRALAIAISRYERVGSLPNAGRDGFKLDQTLRKLGWHVKLETDLGKMDLLASIRTFLEGDLNLDACLFGFVGHGIEVNGKHYLVPKDAVVPARAKNANDFESDVGECCVAFEWVQKTFANKRSGVKPTGFVLDCCRNCDFQTIDPATAVSGLLPSATVEKPPPAKTNLSNSCIVYSTSSGLTASDGEEGSGGPFMNAFTTEMLPGVDIVEIVRRTRSAMNASAGNWQLAPIVETLEAAGFCFAPLPAGENASNKVTDGKATASANNEGAASDATTGKGFGMGKGLGIETSNGGAVVARDVQAMPQHLSNPAPAAGGGEQPAAGAKPTGQSATAATAHHSEHVLSAEVTCAVFAQAFTVTRACSILAKVKACKEEVEGGVPVAANPPKRELLASMVALRVQGREGVCGLLEWMMNKVQSLKFASCSLSS